MKKIVAIGGGENGHENRPYETEKINKEIVRISNKNNPKLLFIGFAGKEYEKSYYDVIKRNFESIGCTTTLFKYEDVKNKELAKKLIEESDIIYIGGGNTINLVKIIKKYEIDKLLYNAYENGTVMAGISAGAICMCRFGISDSRKYKKDSKKYTRATGLGWINLLICPHYNAETRRQRWTKKIMKRTFKVPCIALDNCTAIEIIDDEYKIIKSKKNASVKKLYWKNGEYKKEEIENEEQIKKLSNLLRMY